MSSTGLFYRYLKGSPTYSSGISNAFIKLFKALKRARKSFHSVFRYLRLLMKEIRFAGTTTVTQRKYYQFFIPRYHKNIVTNKFEWTLDDIRIAKIISAPIWATKFFWGKVSALPVVRHCPKLQSCAMSRKTKKKSKIRLRQSLDIMVSYHM